MASYRLFCTRRHRDGSYEVPCLDVVIEAPDDEAATTAARRFPRLSYSDAELAWLLDEAGRTVWSSEDRHLKAA